MPALLDDRFQASFITGFQCAHVMPHAESTPAFRIKFALVLYAAVFSYRCLFCTGIVLASLPVSFSRLPTF